MTAANFKASLKHVLVYEGGYSNHPKDPGGATMRGVTQAVYDGYRARKSLPKRSVRNITTSELEAIYRDQYWDAVRGDALPAGVDFVLFDGAVNSGPSQSVKWLQRALGAKVDGHIGEATLAAIKKHPNHDQLISAICARRLAFLKELKTWPTFGPGWSRRVKSVSDIGRGMSSSDHVAKPDPGLAARAAANDEKMDAKAPETDADTPVISPEAGAAGTAGAATATEVVDKVRDVATELSPLADTLMYVKYGLIALSVVLACVTIYGVYRHYKIKRAMSAA